jgi:predicted pore-forming effector associated with SMODS systems
MDTLDLSKQNHSENIRRLAAQKQLYFDGKRLFLWQFALSVPVTVLLGLSKVALSIFLKIDIAWLTAGFGAALSIFEFAILTNGISSRRTEAAKIQEAFDTNIYGMPWNEFIVGGATPLEIVTRYYRKFEKTDKSGEKIKQLLDWYPIEASGLEFSRGVLICQKTNVQYDFSLREKFMQLIRVSATVTFLLLLIFALIENISIRTMFSQVLLPFLPILAITFKLTQDHNKSLKNLIDLRQHLDKQVEQATLGNVVSMDTLRKLQDRIFLNRKESPLIPEQFYNRLRDDLEEEMHDNASALT